MNKKGEANITKNKALSTILKLLKDYIKILFFIIVEIKKERNIIMSSSNLHASMSPINNSPSKQLFSFPKADRFPMSKKPT